MTRMQIAFVFLLAYFCGLADMKTRSRRQYFGTAMIFSAIVITKIYGFAL